IVTLFPESIKAIDIRQSSRSKKKHTATVMKNLESMYVETSYISNSESAIAQSKRIRNPEDPEAIVTQWIRYFKIPKLFGFRLLHIGRETSEFFHKLQFHFPFSQSRVLRPQKQRIPRERHSF